MYSTLIMSLNTTISINKGTSHSTARLRKTRLTKLTILSNPHNLYSNLYLHLINRVVQYRTSPTEAKRIQGTSERLLRQQRNSLSNLITAIQVSIGSSRIIIHLTSQVAMATSSSKWIEAIHLRVMSKITRRINGDHINLQFTKWLWDMLIQILRIPNKSNQHSKDNICLEVNHTHLKLTPCSRNSEDKTLL
jgi:hypothetical protein